MTANSLLIQLKSFIKDPLTWVCVVYSAIYAIATRFIEKSFISAVGFEQKSYIIGYLCIFLIFWFCLYGVKMAKVAMYYYENRKFYWVDVAILFYFLIVTLVRIVTLPLLYIPSMILFFIMLKIAFPSQKVKAVS